MVDFPTHEKGNILDVVFTDRPELVLDTEAIGYLGKSDHTILAIEINSGIRYTNNNEQQLDWGKADNNGLSNYLNNMNWSDSLQNQNVEDSWNKLKDTLHEGIARFVPSRDRKSPDCPKWFNKHIKKLTRKKQKLWDQYRYNPSPDALSNYKAAEKNCRTTIARAKKKLEKQLSDSPNIRPFSAYIRKKTKTKCSIGPLKEGNNLVTDNKDMATLLNKFFSSVFTREDTVNIPVPDPLPCNTELRNMTFSPANVKETLDKLKPYSAQGPDSIPGRLLQEHSETLSIPLAIIYNKSMATSEVPTDWKKANVTPIFKKGRKSDTGNYRPISLTSIAGKVMESLIKQEIMDHLLRNSLISDSQHGFMPKRSTTTNLLAFFERITEEADNGIPVDILYLDFAKAFDKVPHQRLLAKIRAHGIKGNISEWIASWLKGRTQRTVLNGSASDWEDVLSGVPQGSVLGPLLFLIFINDLDKAVPSIKYISKFADDSKLGHPVPTASDGDELQEAINNLQNWADQWGMKFNTSKCHILHIGRNNAGKTYWMNGIQLPTTQKEKDVGITISDNLKPSQHCTDVARKAQAILYQMSRSFHFRDKIIFVRLYKQYVRCILEYAAPAWSPWSAGDIETLEKVQRRLISLIPGLKGKSYEEKLAEVGLDTLGHRRQRFDMITVYKLIHGYINMPHTTWLSLYENPTQVTRTTNCPFNIIPKHCNTDTRLHFFTNRVVNPWNQLPTEVKESPTINCFKQRYDRHTNSNTLKME